MNPTYLFTSLFTNFCIYIDSAIFRQMSYQQFNIASESKKWYQSITNYDWKV